MLSLIINLLFLGLYLPLLLVRILRWSAIVQQKEYRWDRLLVYLRSSAGRDELIGFIPSIFTHFNTLKRPKLTLRIKLMLIITLVIGTIPAVYFFNTVGLFFTWLLVYYFFFPFVLIFISFPLMLLRYLYTILSLWRARKIILKNQPFIIGITGSYGKTTTKFLLAEVLKSKYKVFTLPSSYNTALSVSQQIIKHYSQEEVLVLEYAAYTKGEIKLMASWLQPNLAVITGINWQHLALFGSKDNLLRAKSELVRSLPIGAVTFVNGADENAWQVAKLGGEKMPIEFSPSKQNIVIANISDMGKITINWQQKNVTTHMVGEHVLSALSAAAAVGEYMGVGHKQIALAWQKFIPNDRFINTRLHNKALVVDDGITTNPKGFMASLHLLAELRKIRKAKRCIVMTGGIIDLGAESKQVHTSLAHQMLDIVSEIWHVGEAGLAEFVAVLGVDKVITDSSQIKRSLKELGEGDILLIEGKVPGIFVPFLKEKRETK